MKILASSPIITDKDKQAVIKAVEKGWFTEGTQCRLFSDKLSQYTRKQPCQLVNSGSSANLVAITAALEKWNKGNLVLTTAVGFPTTVAPIYQNGKVPVYVDLDPETLSPDMGQLAYLVDKYGDDICGAVLGHILGFPFDEVLVREILGDRFFIVDNCDALAAQVRGNPVGKHADIATYSFFPAHHITTAGEGGAVLTDDPELCTIVRSLVSWGRDCICAPGQSNICGKRFEQDYPTLPKGYDHKYTFTRLGYNLKMTELQGAMGVTQMEELDTFVDARKRNFRLIESKLMKFNEYIQPLHIPSWSNPSPFGYPVIMKIRGYTNDLIAYLEQHKISTRRIFAGNITRQPGYTNRPYVKLDLTNSDYLMDNAFWIGCWPGVTKEMIDWIDDVFTSWFEERGLF